MLYVNKVLRNTNTKVQAMYVVYERRKMNNYICLKHNTKVHPSRHHFILLCGQRTEDNLTA